MTRTHQEYRTQIRELGARTIDPNLQALFWKNPKESDLLAYEFRVHLPSGVKSPWHSIDVKKMPCLDWSVHSVLVHHNLDNPWDLRFEMRAVDSLHHGDPPVGIHLATMYEIEYPQPLWQSLNPNQSAMELNISVDNGKDTESRMSFAPSVINLRVREDQSVEEAMLKAKQRGAGVRRSNGEVIRVSASMRRSHLRLAFERAWPNEDYQPSDALGGMLTSREWDLKVWVHSERMDFYIREGLEWSKGYELTGIWPTVHHRP